MTRLKASTKGRRYAKNSAYTPRQGSVVGRGTKINSLPTQRLLAQEQIDEGASGPGMGNGTGMPSIRYVLSNVETVPFS